MKDNAYKAPSTGAWVRCLIHVGFFLFPLCAQLGRCQQTCLLDRPLLLKDIQDSPLVPEVPVSASYPSAPPLSWVSLLPTAAHLNVVSRVFCFLPWGLLGCCQTLLNLCRRADGRGKSPGPPAASGERQPVDKCATHPSFGRKFLEGSLLTSWRPSSIEPLFPSVVICYPQ